MNKVVYNAAYGGFSMSNKAINWLLDHGYKKPEDPDFLIERDISRHNPLLVQCVEELGNEANGLYSRLTIAEIESDKLCHTTVKKP